MNVFEGPRRPDLKRGFQYCLIQYRPDATRPEGVNVGVIVHDLESGQIHYRHLEDFTRVHQLGPHANLDGIHLMMNVLMGSLMFSTREDGLWAGVIHGQEVLEGVQGVLCYSDVKDGARAHREDIHRVIDTLFNQHVA